MRGPKLFVFAILLALAAALAACGSGSTIEADADSAAGIDTFGFDTSVDTVQVDTVQPVDTYLDTLLDTLPDTPYIIPDVEFPDLLPNTEPPVVVSTSPKDGEGNVSVPFEIRIEFSKALATQTVNKQTIVVEDAGDNQILGTYAFESEDHVVVFTPTQPVFHASPYKVTLGPYITDATGIKFGTEMQFSFFTGPFPGTEHYEAIAAKYSPVIYGETYNGQERYDYLTRFNFDNNWLASDNDEHIKAASVKVNPYVYYNVIESKSHYFITYGFFWPLRYNDDGNRTFGNDMAGAVVVVRKADDTPIIVDLFSKSMDIEDSHAYISSASTLVPAEGNPSDYRFEDRFPADELFPNNHFPSYLSNGPKGHQSCLWIDVNNGVLAGCVLNDGLKTGMSKVQYVYGYGDIDTLQKIPNPPEGSPEWPTNVDGIKYGLEPIIDTLWARRDQVDSLDADAPYYTAFNYTPFAGRPDVTIDIPSLFNDGVGKEFDRARPPWAWTWKDEAYYELPRGAMVLDPAAYFAARHNTKDDWAEYDPETGLGWSLDYCFNPFFNIISPDPDCAAE